MKTALVEKSVYARPNLAMYNRVKAIYNVGSHGLGWVCKKGGSGGRKEEEGQRAQRGREEEGETNRNINPLATIMLGVRNQRVSGAR